jgi:dCMP deaminase
MLASERATCPRMHCGCVLVRDKHVLATGYNGSLPGLAHCDDVGCLVVDNHCIRTNHAEMNAITQAAKNGVSISGGTAYVTNMPCTTCAKALIGAGIKRVVVFSDYHSTHAEEFFRDADVRLDRQKMPGCTINYDLESFTSAIRFKDDPSEDRS